ncbi:MAG: YkvA family protein [Anaerolineae bacterium]
MTTNPRSPNVVAAAVRELQLAWRLLRDPQVPMWTKATPLLSLAYLLWPVDLLPDPLIGLGQLDDLAVILLGLRLFVALCPQALVRRYQGASGRAEPSGKGEVIDTTYRVLDERDQP